MAWKPISLLDGGYQSPCKDCPDRHMNCHSECIEYIEFRKKQDEHRRKVNAEKEAQRSSYDGMRDAYSRFIKKNGSLKNKHGGGHD